MIPDPAERILQSNERRIIRSLRSASRVITAKFESVDRSTGLLILKSVDGSTFRARPISDRIPTGEEPLQVTVPGAGQLPIVDNKIRF